MLHALAERAKAPPTRVHVGPVHERSSYFYFYVTSTHARALQRVKRKILFEKSLTF
jgi:hypothetical protein